MLSGKALDFWNTVECAKCILVLTAVGVTLSAGEKILFRVVVGQHGRTPRFRILLDEGSLKIGKQQQHSRLHLTPNFDLSSCPIRQLDDKNFRFSCSLKEETKHCIQGRGMVTLSFFFIPVVAIKAHLETDWLAMKSVQVILGYECL